MKGALSDRCCSSIFEGAVLARTWIFFRFTFGRAAIASAIQGALVRTGYKPPSFGGDKVTESEHCLL
jgi:hypothetical protein